MCKQNKTNPKRKREEGGKGRGEERREGRGVEGTYLRVLSAKCGSLSLKTRLRPAGVGGGGGALWLDSGPAPVFLCHLGCCKHHTELREEAVVTAL